MTRFAILVAMAFCAVGYVSVAFNGGQSILAGVFN